MSDIFGINFLVVSKAHIPRFSGLTMQVIVFLIHAHNRVRGIVKPLYIENIFHTDYESASSSGGDTPVVVCVRSLFVFYVLRMVSRLTRASRTTLAFSSSR